MARQRQKKDTTPANPAPVSGPGELSARTDGGPGSTRQPIRVASGQPFGQRQALERQQAAAPLPQTTGPPSPGPTGGGAAPAPLPPGPGLFGPTARPNEPLTAGTRNQFIPRDPDMLLQALYQVSGGHPEIGALLRASPRIR